jgi:glucosylceramidase
MNLQGKRAALPARCIAAPRPRSVLRALLVAVMALLPFAPRQGLMRLAHGAAAAKIWLTTASLNDALTALPDIAFTPDLGDGHLRIDVDEAVTFQQMDGFGAAMTDTSAWLIATKLARPTRDRLMQALFNRSSGIAMSWVRIPMGSSDYTHDQYYSYDDNGRAPDPQLSNFSIRHDRAYILPVLRQARRIDPAIKFDANPWSPPGWMKSNSSLTNGGHLLSRYYGALAEYFVKFLAAYLAEGIPVYAVQPQNEPLAQTSYPSMYWDASDQARFIASYLGPTLAAAHLHAKILGFDHNWDQPGYPVTLLSDPIASPYIAGTAWHTYFGAPSAMRSVHALYPAKDTYETESSAASPADMFINAARDWSRTGVMWNIALDTSGGPLPNRSGCRGCIGLVTIDQAAGTYRFTKNYYQIGHFSRFVQPGAVRIASTSYGSRSIEDVAFENPDGGKVLVLFNGGAGAKAFQVTWHRESLRVALPAGATCTLTWR